MAIPIDLVYTWVDGDDPAHAALRRIYRQRAAGSVRGDASNANRFRSCGEIYESIRSAWHFAPWLRHIYVVVDDTQQSRLDVSEWPGRVSVVPHSAIYQWDADHLPVFNSHSIETHLFAIPGLSEQFLYANDDTFFGATVTPDQFFHADGHPYVFPSKDLLLRSRALVLGTHESWAWSRVNNAQLLDKLARSRMGVERYEWIHQIRALRRAYFEEAWHHPVIGPRLETTSQSRFRSAQDLEPVGFLLHWKTDQGVTHHGRLASRVVSVDDRTPLVSLFAQLHERPYHLYCLNDAMVAPLSDRLARYKTLLATSLPHHQPSAARVRVLAVTATHSAQPKTGVGAFSQDRTASMGHIRK